MARDKLIQFRRNTASVAASSNPVLAAGEPGFASDTNQLKVGDGTTAWASLPEVGSGTYVQHLGASNGTDDTATIQAALTAARNAGRGIVRGKSGENYLITSRLVIGSGTTLDMRGCKVTEKAGSNSQMVTNYSVTAPVSTAADGSMTAGSNILTSPTLAAVAVVGQMVEVTGADGGGTGPVVGYVSAVNVGANQLTLLHLDRVIPANATTTVAAAAVKLFNVDTDITVLGGTWDRGANGPNGGAAPIGTAIAGHSFYFKHVYNLHVDLDRILSTAGITFVWITSVTHHWLRIRAGNVVRTAAQIVGPIHDGHIDYVGATTTDDMVNICGHVYVEQTETCGDVTAMTVRKIVNEGGTGTAFKLNAGASQVLYSVKVDEITGANGVFIGEDTTRAETTGGSYGTIDIGLIDCYTVGTKPLNMAAPIIDTLKAKVINRNATLPVWMYSVTNNTTIGRCELDIESTYATGGTLVGVANASSIGTLIVRPYMRNNTSTGTAAVRVTNTSTVQNLIIENGDMVSPITDWCVLQVEASAVVQKAILRNVKMTWPSTAGSSRAVFLLTNTCTLSDVTIEGGYYVSGNVLVRAAAGTTPMRITFTGGVFTSGTDRIVNSQVPTKIWFEGLNATGLTSIPIFAGNSQQVDLYGSGISIAGQTQLVQRSGTEVINVWSPALPVDFSVVAKTAGTTGYNTNGAVAPFTTGPAIADGARWKSLITGATKFGNATLVGGNVTVADTNITASSIIRLGVGTLGGTPGALYVSAKVAATSFTITSTNAADTSVVNYWIDAY